MKHTHSFHSFLIFAMAVLALCAAQTVFAQTTLITHQGKLEFDGGVPVTTFATPFVFPLR